MCISLYGCKCSLCISLCRGILSYLFYVYKFIQRHIVVLFYVYKFMQRHIVVPVLRVLVYPAAYCRTCSTCISLSSGILSYLFYVYKFIQRHIVVLFYVYKFIQRHIVVPVLRVLIYPAAYCRTCSTCISLSSGILSYLFYVYRFIQRHIVAPVLRV